MRESQPTADQFLDAVRRSGLLSDAQLATLSQELLSTGTKDAPAIADKLVEQHTLTVFQAEQLLAGRGEACVLAGRYHILELLGAGAMGAVYKGTDAKLDRVVAIKVLPQQSVSDRDAVARFQREAKALAKLAHPNIVQAYDSGEDRDRHFLVMECVEGESLAKLLRDRGRVSPTLAADYGYQAAHGLQHAHEKGLVHRDLKPSNLFLTRDRQVKILDLGLARFLQDQVGDATLTREEAGMGTPDYMAPEQFHDARHVDARSDIYSLGCTLYHLLTGGVPFPGSSMSEKYEAHETKEPPAIEESCPEIPAGLALVVTRMMAKRPADRFQSAREVAEALGPYVAGSSHAILNIRATASWHGSQLGLSVVPLRVRRRRKWMIASCATVGAAVIVALSFWAGGLFRPNETDGMASRNVVTDQPEPKPKPAPADPVEPNVLTVAQNGSGQFQTIREALDRVQPAMTIRVLDDGSYSEELLIDDPQRQSGVRVEAPQRATLKLTAQTRRAITIKGVPNVRIDGFRFRSQGASKDASCIVLSGSCSGVRLEGLDIQTDCWGIAAQNVNASVESPLIISHCNIEAGMIGVSISGGGGGTPAAFSDGFLVHSNRISGGFRGVHLQGLVKDIHINGNVMEM
jgi:predicted Ser/Thr protein kinase